MLSKLFVASTVVATTLPTTEARPNSRRHVLLILADDMGLTDIGYADSDFHTPTLDSLANDGIRLDKMYVESTCAPTRASLLTGRHTNKVGLHDGAMPPGDVRTLSHEYPLLSEVLQNDGYRTVGIGKWHLGSHTVADTPTERGFDEFFGNYQGAVDYYDHDIGLQCNSQNPINPDQYPPSYGSNCYILNGIDVNDNGVPQPQLEGQYYTDVLAAKAVEKINSHHGNDELFMYLAPTAPHAPMQPSLPYLQLCPATATMPEGSAKQVLCAMMASVDHMVADVLSALESKDMLDETLILFSSDNGGVNYFGSSNGGLRGQKGDVFEGGVRAPAFINHAKMKKKTKGSTYDGLVHITDFFTTITEFAGLDDVSSDGQSLLKDNGKKLSNKFDRDHVIFSAAGEYFENNAAVIFTQDTKHFKYAISPEVFSYIAGYTNSWELGESEGPFLFDLSNDPLETTNLFSDPAFAAAVQTGSEMLTTFKTPSAITSFMWMPGIPNENGCWIPTDSPYSVTDTSSPSYVYCGPPALPFPQASPTLPAFFPNFKQMLFQRRAMEYQLGQVSVHSSVESLVGALVGTGGATGQLVMLKQTTPATVLTTVETEMTAVEDASQELEAALLIVGGLLNAETADPVAIQVALVGAVAKALAVFDTQDLLIAALPANGLAQKWAVQITQNRDIVLEAQEAGQDVAAAVTILGQKALEAQAYCGALCGYTGGVTTTSTPISVDKVQLRGPQAAAAAAAGQKMTDASRLRELETTVFTPYPVSGF